MGTPMAPAAANLFMGKLETALFESSPIPMTEEFWRRFIDDILMLWTGTPDDLNTFLDYINTFHHSIKFTHIVSSKSSNFNCLLESFEKLFFLFNADIHPYMFVLRKRYYKMTLGFIFIEFN